MLRSLPRVKKQKNIMIFDGCGMIPSPLGKGDRFSGG